MIFSHIAHDCLVEIISGNLYGSRHNRASHGNHGNISGSASYIHDQITKRLRHIYSGTNCSCNRLFHKKHFPCSGLISSFLYCLSFNLCGSAGDTDTDSRLSKSMATHCLGNEILQHLLHNRIIYDHSLADWPYYFHI